MSTLIIKITSQENLHFGYVRNVLHDNFDNLVVELDPRLLTTDAPGMTVGDSYSVSENSTDEREACPDDRHTYYEMMLDYQFCPYCAKRLHWMGPTNDSCFTPPPTPSFR